MSNEDLKKFESKIMDNIYKLREDIDGLDKLLNECCLMIITGKILDYKDEDENEASEEIMIKLEHIKAMTTLFCMDLNQYVNTKCMERGDF